MDVSFADPERWTPLQRAVQDGDISIFPTLAQSGADIEALNPDGETPLISAVGAGDFDAVNQLLQLRADVNHADSEGWSPLHCAIEIMSTRIIELLVNSGADIEAFSPGGETPLIMAVQANDLELVGLLLRSGAVLTHADAAGRTPLHFAAEIDSLPIARLLVQSGADIHAPNDRQETPLMLAALGRDSDTAEDSFGLLKYLLSHGADLRSREEEGHGIVEYMTEEEYECILHTELVNPLCMVFFYPGLQDLVCCSLGLVLFLLLLCFEAVESVFLLCVCAFQACSSSSFLTIIQVPKSKEIHRPLWSSPVNLSWLTKDGH